MEYRINNTLISTWGMVPMVKSGDLAVKGALDLPKRVQPTEYNWGTAFEFFTSATDIAYERRDIELNLFAQASTMATLLTNIAALKTACKQEGATLLTPVGTFNVILKGEIDVKHYYGQPMADITVKFSTADVYLPVLGTSAGTGAFNIDGYGMYVNFGMVMTGCDGLFSIGAISDIEAVGTNTKSLYRQPNDIQIKCITTSDTLAGLKTNIGKLSTLLMKAGQRTAQIPVASGTNQLVTGYVRDGIQVQWVRKDSKWYAELYFKLRVP
jgi:hypothetical protein